MSASQLSKRRRQERWLSEILQLEDTSKRTPLVVKLPSGRQNLRLVPALRHSLCQRVAAEITTPHDHDWMAFLDAIIGEAVTNAFVHSDRQTPIQVDYVVTDDEICFRVHNFSHEIPVTAPHLPKDLTEGGFGECVIQELANIIGAAIDYQCVPKGQRNEIIFICSLPR